MKNNGNQVKWYEKDGNLFDSKKNNNCLQDLHLATSYFQNKYKVAFTINKNTIGSLTEEIVDKYLAVLQEFFKFKVEKEIYGWDFVLDYADYNSAKSLYVTFIHLRYLYYNNDSRAVITKMFEIKERTKYRWIKCLQLAQIWKPGSIGNSLFMSNYLPWKLFDDFNFLIDNPKLNLYAQTTSCKYVKPNEVQELKDVIKLVKENTVEKVICPQLMLSIIENKVNYELLEEYLLSLGYRLTKRLENPKDVSEGNLVVHSASGLFLSRIKAKKASGYFMCEYLIPPHAGIFNLHNTNIYVSFKGEKI